MPFWNKESRTGPQELSFSLRTVIRLLCLFAKAVFNAALFLLLFLIWSIVKGERGSEPAVQLVVRPGNGGRCRNGGDLSDTDCSTGYIQSCFLHNNTFHFRNFVRFGNPSVPYLAVGLQSFMG